ncbi:MAG: hypothetical protein ACFNP4_11940 [Capnocytophaga gingivalis]|uniref:hypothetical protein n=1 Tax=Capnocytophaga gingivalis TaxID=1017 RepID=UPI00361573DC
MNTEIPQNMAAYFQAHPEQFVLKADVAKKSTYGLLFAVCLVLMIKPDLIPVGELWIWRVIAGIGMVVTGIGFYLASDFYNKQTQTKIEEKGLKKFDSAHTSVEELSQLLEQGNYQELANLPAKKDQPLQMYVYEDTQNKTFYLLLMKYFSPSDFRGVTPVKIVSGADYDRYKTIIRAINSEK